MYLEQFDEPIPVQVITPIRRDEVTRNNFLIPPVDPQEALEAFHQYLTEAGEEWSDHNDYLWPRWVTDGEVENFELAKGLKSEPESRSCESLILLP